MPDITISIDEKTLKACHEYVTRHGTSLSDLVCELLEQRVLRNSCDWVDECFAKMDGAQGNSRGKKWARSDIYRI
jgi:hypothetical protein